MPRITNLAGLQAYNGKLQASLRKHMLVVGQQSLAVTVQRMRDTSESASDPAPAGHFHTRTGGLINSEGVDQKVKAIRSKAGLGRLQAKGAAIDFEKAVKFDGLKLLWALGIGMEYAKYVQETKGLADLAISEAPAVVAEQWTKAKGAIAREMDGA